MRKLFLTYAVIITVLIIAPGYQQQFCCGGVTDHYICIKGSDTAVIDISGRLNNVHAQLADSLNYYQGMNYTYSNNDNQKGPSWWPTCVYGLIHRREAINGGDSCGTPGIEGLCNPQSGCD